MQADLLKTLGLMRRAGKLSAGEDGVRQAVRQHTAKLILVAADASDNALKRAQGFADASRAPLIRLDENKEGLDNKSEVINRLKGIRAELQRIYDTM